MPVEAYQLTEGMVSGDSLPPGVHRNTSRPEVLYVVPVQGRPVVVGPGEWIVKERDGEHHYPIADDVFCHKYERETD